MGACYSDSQGTGKSRCLRPCCLPSVEENQPEVTEANREAGFTESRSNEEDLSGLPGDLFAGVIAAKVAGPAFVDASSATAAATQASSPNKAAPSEQDPTFVGAARSSEAAGGVASDTLRLAAGDGVDAPQEFDASPAVPSTGLRDATEEDREARAWRLLRRLRVLEASDQFGGAEASDEALREALRFQNKWLEEALAALRRHPALSDAAETASSAPSSVSGCEGCTPASSSAKRDILDINFDLDDEGRRVDLRLEFFADGTASIAWSASNLPVTFSRVLCLVHENDLIGDLVPFVEVAETVHQFASNDADKIVRVISKPPIPFVSGLEACSQRLGFDLLDHDQFQGFVLMESAPRFEPAPGSTKGSPETFRGLAPIPPKRKGLRQVDKQTAVALGRPCGASGELTTIFFSAVADVKIGRWMLPDSLVTWLIKLIGRFIYRRALEKIAAFDTSEHGKRLKASSFYPPIMSRLEEFLVRQRSTVNGEGSSA